MEAVEALGYVANLQARSLAGGHSQIIGLLVPNLDNGYVGTIMQGIDRELARANYEVCSIQVTATRQGNVLVDAIANGLTEVCCWSPHCFRRLPDALRERHFPMS
jgi:DNA-binding LacI/PurR family transcriptional regulator